MEIFFPKSSPFLKVSWRRVKMEEAENFLEEIWPLFHLFFIITGEAAEKSKIEGVKGHMKGKMASRKRIFRSENIWCCKYWQFDNFLTWREEAEQSGSYQKMLQEV